ncbi:hypothetical protein [Pseudoroseicyclus sp. CXY001]|uniref:hypothetical protein n=1 Tax=Pseudoroseicyclus sp. CXY001 TaxID=3242492 RepID=UPI003570F8C2
MSPRLPCLLLIALGSSAAALPEAAPDALELMAAEAPPLPPDGWVLPPEAPGLCEAPAAPGLGWLDAWKAAEAARAGLPHASVPC